MKDTEQILAAHGIDNPADASLVRLASVAISSPEEDADVLLKRVNFVHPSDAKLAKAIIETVRANTPRSTARPSRSIAFLAAGCAVIAIGLGVWAIELNRSLSSERLDRQHQAEQFAKEVGELQATSAKTIANLQAQTTAALNASGSTTKEAAERFTTTLNQYVQTINALTTENVRLKSDLAAAQAAKQPTP